MKRFFHFFILAVIVSLVSCAKDDVVLPAAEEGDFEVAFTLTPTEDETDAVATRAYNAGEHIRDLEYAIYRKNSDNTYTFIKSAAQEEFFAEGLTNTLDVHLAYGKSYVLMLWADASDANYTVTWDEADPTNSKVAITGTSALVSQDDSADAFYAKYEFVANESSVSVRMTRPFAQVNICADDYDAAVEKGFTATQTSMAVEAYTSLNLFSGAVGDKTAVTYAFAALPTGDDASIEVNGTTYKRLAMNYLFAPTEAEPANITFYAEATANSLSFTDVDITRNKRTNIVGSLLSANDDWEVYYTEFDVKVMTWNICNAYPYIAVSGTNVGYPWSIRRAAIAQMIEDSDADIICLQELNCTGSTTVSIKFFRDIMQLLNDVDPNSLAASWDGNYSSTTWPVETYNGSTYTGRLIKRGAFAANSSADEGDAIIYKTSKFTDVTSTYDTNSNSGYFWLSTTPNEESIYSSGGYTANHKRICLFKRLKHNETGHEFVVAGVHIDNSNSSTDITNGLPVMNGQVQILINNLRAKALTKNEQRKYDDTANFDKFDRCPVIIVGDMNANPSHSPIKRFGYNIAYGFRTTANPSDNTTVDNDFADCYTVAEGANATMTYPTPTALRSTMVDITINSAGDASATQNIACFDYIFMRWGHSVKSYEIHRPTLETFTYYDNGITYNDVLLSDHNAVSAVINLRYYD